MKHKRLRDMPTPIELAALYPTPHDHTLWGHGHDVRVVKTIQTANDVLPPTLLPRRIADLSCGNGAIAHGIADERDAVVLGDYAPGCAICGPIEDTLDLIEPVDVFICAETLEHLDNPYSVLRKIRKLTTHVVASTPIDNWDDTNTEHVHAWDREHVEWMFTDADFHVMAYDYVDSRQWKEPYLYGIWVLQ